MGTEIVTEPPSSAVSEALAIIDAGLRRFNEREIASADEVSNLLLDLRLLLADLDGDDLAAPFELGDTSLS